MERKFLDGSTRGIVVVFAMVGLALLAGCQARQPGRLETSVMESAKRRFTIRGRSDPNPLDASAENIHSGQRNFTAYCMVCHGLDGQNSGVPFASMMAPPVPPLNSAAVQAYSDGQLHWIIQNGIFPSGMPASKQIFQDEEIWQLVLYIRHLPPKGSLGEPQVYGGSGPPQEKTSTGGASANSAAR